MAKTLKDLCQDIDLISSTRFFKSEIKKSRLEVDELFDCKQMFVDTLDGRRQMKTFFEQFNQILQLIKHIMSLYFHLDLINYIRLLFILNCFQTFVLPRFDLTANRISKIPIGKPLRVNRFELALINDYFYRKYQIALDRL